MTTETACAHRWLIDSPNGPTSAGQCTLCGEIRNDFRNSLGGNAWGADAQKKAAQATRGRTRSAMNQSYRAKAKRGDGDDSKLRVQQAEAMNDGIWR